MQYSNKLSFKKRELSFKHLLIYLFKFINQWAPRNTYFRSPKGSQKIFLSSSLGWGYPFEIMFPEGHTKLAYFIKHVLTTYYVVKLQYILFGKVSYVSMPRTRMQAFCSDNVIMWKSTIGPVQLKVTRPISWQNMGLRFPTNTNRLKWGKTKRSANVFCIFNSNTEIVTGF